MDTLNQTQLSTFADAGLVLIVACIMIYFGALVVATLCKKEDDFLKGGRHE